MPELTLVADGLTWPESPRWRDGKLWISDVHNFRVIRVAESGQIEQVAHVPGRPAGMGFMPDGRLLLATALERQLLWVAANGSLSLAADLKPVTKSLLNDMVVDRKGRAWVGDTGFVFGSDEPEKPGALLLFDERGRVRVVAEDIRFPNGIVISPDQKTLYVAETFGNRITAFDIEEDGTLGGRRVHAVLESSPDGLCLDAEDHLWVPLLFQKQFHRVAPNGAVVERIVLENERAIACVLGGKDRRTLFLCVSAIDDSQPKAVVRRGSVYSLRCPTPGAGLP
jgi:sugar lactone lactonase YvrE